MGFKRAIPAPTKSQQQRQNDIRELGCIACWLDAHPHTPCEIQHLNSCGRNMGQDYTIGLCPWHHRGVIPDTIRLGSQAELILGPSFARTPRQFHDRYGSDMELLEKQNIMLTKYREVVHATRY